MFKQWHNILMGIFYVLDISLSLLALYFADHLVLLFTGAQQLAFADSFPYLIVVIIWTLSFRILPIYSSKRAEPILNDLGQVAFAAAFSWFLFTGSLFLYGYPLEARLPAVVFGILDLLFLVAFHISLRIFLRYVRTKGYDLKKVLIVGAGYKGQQVASTLLDRPWMGFSIVGFLDPAADLAGRQVLSLPVLGQPNKLRDILETFEVDDEVIIALPSAQQYMVEEIIQSIEDIPVNVRISPDICATEYIRPRVEDLWGIPLLGIRRSTDTSSYAMLKRDIDFVGALLGLILFTPIMLVVAVLIKLDSKGPVLFVQERVGENGKKFKLYKFRTMVNGSEQMLAQLVNLDTLEEPVFKLKDDPRVTHLGHFLRRTSIDELPQFYNVLIGDMSLVGPRPEEVFLVSKYNSWHRNRLRAKPGLTGPAQVNGRADLTLKERVQLEIDYINNYSLATDIKILIKTIPAVIRGDGSY